MTADPGPGSGRPAARPGVVPAGAGAGPRHLWEGWTRWRLTRRDFVPAPVITAAEHARMTPRQRRLHDLHRIATHSNLADPGNPDERLRLPEDAGPDRGQRLLPRPGHPARRDDQRRRLPGQDRDRLRSHGLLRGRVARPLRPEPGRGCRDAGPARAGRLRPHPGQGHPDLGLPADPGLLRRALQGHAAGGPAPHGQGRRLSTTAPRRS